MKKVEIQIKETDGLKSMHEAWATEESIMKVVSKYIPTMSYVKINDREFKCGVNLQLNLPILIKDFLDEH